MTQGSRGDRDCWTKGDTAVDPNVRKEAYARRRS